MGPCVQWALDMCSSRPSGEGDRSLLDPSSAPDREVFTPVVVAPTHDNQNTLEDVLARIRTLGLPLIVVNDGSSDATAERLASDRWRGDAGVTVLSHPRNRG